MEKIVTLHVSLIKGVSVDERMRERRRHAQNTVTAAVDSQKEESLNGAAKLS